MPDLSNPNAPPIADAAVFDLSSAVQGLARRDPTDPRERPLIVGRWDGRTRRRTSQAPTSSPPIAAADHRPEDEVHEPDAEGARKCPECGCWVERTRRCEGCPHAWHELRSSR